MPALSYSGYRSPCPGATPKCLPARYTSVYEANWVPPLAPLSERSRETSDHKQSRIGALVLTLGCRIEFAVKNNVIENVVLRPVRESPMSSPSHLFSLRFWLHDSILVGIIALVLLFADCSCLPCNTAKAFEYSLDLSS